LNKKYPIEKYKGGAFASPFLLAPQNIVAFIFVSVIIFLFLLLVRIYNLKCFKI